MKKILFILVFIFFSINFIKINYANELKKNFDKSIISFLDNYFKNNTYVIIGDNYKFGGKTFVFVGEYNKKNVEIKIEGEILEYRKVINKGIIFEVNNKKVIPYLYIDGGKLLNKSKKIIFDFGDSKAGYTNKIFFGWEVKLITKKPNIANGEIYFTLYYINNEGFFGNFDEFSYDWDSQKETFIFHKEDLGLVPM